MAKPAVAHTLITKGLKVEEGILVGVRGPNTGREYVLVGQEIRLGRGDDCDIILNDINASRHHAVIRNQQGQFVIVDLQSKNKTYVNDREIQQTRLTHKDLIQIGESTFRFHMTRPNTTRGRRQNSQADMHFKLAMKNTWSLPQLPSLKISSTAQPLRRMILIAAVAMLGILVAMWLFKSPTKSRKEAALRSSNAAPVVKVLTPFDQTVRPVSLGQTAKSNDDAPRSLSLAREHYSQGMQALDVGDYKRAISLFESVLVNDPSHPIAAQKVKQSKQRLNDQIQEYYNNGLREYSKLYFERAIVEWQKTAALSADYSQDYFDKANHKISEAKAKLLESR